MSTEAGDAADLQVQRARVREGYERIADAFDRHAFVEPLIRGRLLERLDLVRLQPRLIVDAGCATGAGVVALATRYGHARVVGVDLSPRMVRHALRRPRWWQRRRMRAVVADAAAMPLADASVDLVFSNLMLQWHPQPDAVFAECRRVLRPGGLLLFSTLGPDTLVELRRAFRRVDDAAHVNLFIDMHDLGDALLRAGLAAPVMDTERLRIEYRGFDALVADLRRSTPGNVLAGRPRGLVGSARAQRLRAAFDSRHDGGPGAVTVEVVYGHAWREAEPGTGVDARAGSTGVEVRVPITAVRRRTPPDETV